jgi:hypothetical protein
MTTPSNRAMAIPAMVTATPVMVMAIPVIATAGSSSTSPRSATRASLRAAAWATSPSSRTSGTAMFDPISEQWTVLADVLGYGLQEDANKTMWLGTFSPPGLRAINIETMQVGKWIMLPTNSSRGVSVDFYGYVWFVDQGTSAWRVDTDAETWEAYAGLNGPYTYSDMTGWGLNLASGGIPQG